MLQKEAIDALRITRASIIVDATLGAGGHARDIVSALGPQGTFIGIDVDETAVEEVTPTINGLAMVHIRQSNFADIGHVLDELEIPFVHGILADLGWRSDQFITNGRGFSFTDEEGLLMTFGDSESYTFTAYDIVNEWEESSIADIIYGYGEEHQSRKIAKAIVAARAVAPITNAKMLAEIIVNAMRLPHRRGRIHPATKTFQAIRIAVNDELNVLERFVAEAFHRLLPGGRLAIITFHSLEDRIVKLAFRSYTHDHTGQLVCKKPITASNEELQKNPRARSAKLRIIEKL